MPIRVRPAARYGIIADMRLLAFVFSFATALLVGGCAHEQFVTDAQHPEIAVSETGIVTYRGRPVEAEDLPGLLKDSGLTRKDTIHIHIPSGTTDFRVPYYVMGILVKNGFTRPVFVEDRKSSSTVKRKEAPPMRAAPPARRPIRYK